MQSNVIEKIVSYSNEKDIFEIIEKNFSNHYYFVRHNTKTKQLFFKNFELPKQTSFEAII